MSVKLRSTVSTRTIKINRNLPARSTSLTILGEDGSVEAISVDAAELVSAIAEESRVRLVPEDAVVLERTHEVVVDESALGLGGVTVELARGNALRWALIAEALEADGGEVAAMLEVLNSLDARSVPNRDLARRLVELGARVVKP